METMRKNFVWLFMALFVGVSFTSCKDDDEEGASGYEAQIIGTWQAVKYQEFSADGQLIYEDADENANDYTEFKADHTGRWYALPYEWAPEGEEDLFTWKIEGKRLCMTFEGDGSEYFDIESINGNEAVVTSTEEDDGRVVTCKQYLRKIQ